MAHIAGLLVWVFLMLSPLTCTIAKTQPYGQLKCLEKDAQQVFMSLSKLRLLVIHHLKKEILDKLDSTPLLVEVLSL